MKRVRLILMAAVLAAACGGSTPPAPTLAPGVYVAGWESNGMQLVAKVWNHGAANPLPLTNGTQDGSAQSVAISGSDVYVAGYELTLVSASCVGYGSDSGTTYCSGSGESNAVAMVWKNGIATPLPLTNGTQSGSAQSVAISGSDVYVAGNTDNVATVWKNGAATPLTDGTQEARAYCVAISGSDVYVAGDEFNAVYASDSHQSRVVAVVWKNGVATPLTDGTQNASAQSVAVSGSDIYVAGYELNGTNHVAKVWKNGAATPLTDGTHEAYAYSVAISGSDVYVAGWESNGTSHIATVWRNGVAIPLTDGARNARAYSVAISGSDFYVAGVEFVRGLNVAMVWKNGVATILTDGTQDAQANFILVNSH